MISEDEQRWWWPKRRSKLWLSFRVHFLTTRFFIIIIIIIIIIILGNHITKASWYSCPPLIPCLRFFCFTYLISVASLPYPGFTTSLGWVASMSPSISLSIYSYKHNRTLQVFFLSLSFFFVSLMVSRLPSACVCFLWWDSLCSFLVLSNYAERKSSSIPVWGLGLNWRTFVMHS